MAWAQFILTQLRNDSAQLVECRELLRNSLLLRSKASREELLFVCVCLGVPAWRALQQLEPAGKEDTPGETAER